MWTAEKLHDVIAKLQEKGRLSDEQNLMYVVNPYALSMGYDVFNMDEADLDIKSGRLTINVADGLKIIIGLTSYLPTSEDVKVFLNINVKEYRLTMHLRALDQWERVDEIDISQEDTRGDYPQMMRMLAKDSLGRSYEERGERLFTEGVLRKQLQDGEFNNRFVKSVIRKELKNPSELFIKVIAERLSEEFSTDNVATIMEGLMPLREIGVESIVAGVLPVVNTSARKYSEPDYEQDTQKEVENTRSFHTTTGKVIKEEIPVEVDNRSIFRDTQGEKLEEISSYGESKGMEDVFRVSESKEEKKVVVEEKVEDVKVETPEYTEPVVRSAPPLKRSREPEDVVMEKAKQNTNRVPNLMTVLNPEGE